MTIMDLVEDLKELDKRMVLGVAMSQINTLIELDEEPYGLRDS